MTAEPLATEVLTPEVLIPGRVTLDQLERVYRGGARPVLDPVQRSAVDAAAAVVVRAAQGEAPIYGVNTGFGKLQQVRIGCEDREQLQHNLILSHCCGVGEPLPAAVVRLMIALKIVSLGRGASGVSWDLLERLQHLAAAKDVVAVIPNQGSVGASGDLAPLAHLTAVLLGAGEAVVEGELVDGATALRHLGLEPYVLGPKEGLGMINGTQFSTALALAGLFEARRLLTSALVTGALSTDGAMGSPAPFRAEVHRLRGHRGQAEVGAALRCLMRDSGIRESHRKQDERVQDPYCIRCQPQVMGPCVDLWRQAAECLVIEANAVTDNPLVLVDSGEILSGGNFHAECVGFAADQLAMALAETGSLAQRRIATLVDPSLNYGLPAFLVDSPGVHSGLMIAEVTAAALMAENKQRAMPCTLDSTPTSANQEDHVSMAAHGARRLGDLCENLAQLLGIELVAAAQAVEMRRPLTTSPLLAKVIARLRQEVAFLDGDRYLAPDLACAARLIRSGEAVGAADLSDCLSYPRATALTDPDLPERVS